MTVWFSRTVKNSMSVRIWESTSVWRPYNLIFNKINCILIPGFLQEQVHLVETRFGDSRGWRFCPLWWFLLTKLHVEGRCHQNRASKLLTGSKARGRSNCSERAVRGCASMRTLSEGLLVPWSRQSGFEEVPGAGVWICLSRVKSCYFPWDSCNELSLCGVDVLVLLKHTACFPRCKSGKTELLADICTEPRVLTDVCLCQRQNGLLIFHALTLSWIYPQSLLLRLNRVTGSIEKRIWERLFGWHQ